MGDPAKPPTACELAQDVLAFVLEFPGDELPLLPEQIEKVLQSEALRKKLQTTLFEYAFDKTKKGQVFQPNDPQLGVALLNSTSEVAQKELVSEILKGEPAKRILKTFDEFNQALSKTPMGVWVDKNKGWLIVVGVVIAAGGAAALFYTRTDSDVVNFPISQIKGKAVPLWSPGNFKLSGSIIEFKPADRKLGLEIIGEQKWERLDVKVKLGVVGSDPVATPAPGAAAVSTRTFHAPQMKYSLGIEFKIKPEGMVNPISLGLHATVENDKFSQGGLSAATTYKGVDFGLKAQTDGKATSGWFFIGGSF